MIRNPSFTQRCNYHFVTRETISATDAIAALVYAHEEEPAAAEAIADTPPPAVTSLKTDVAVTAVTKPVIAKLSPTNAPTVVIPIATLFPALNPVCEILLSDDVTGCFTLDAEFGAGERDGATVHGIKLGNCVTFVGGGGEVGGGVGFAIKTGIGDGVGAGVALTAGLEAGAADALLILRSDPPPITRDITIVRIISFSFPFKEIPNDYGQKYFF